jgi:acyl-CoA synthetase (AMP-forming)/AMP-acid ligase II
MNVGMHVVRAARFFGERTAIIDGGRSLSFRALDERTNRLAHALVGRGLKRNDRALLVLPNSAEWIEADFALAKAGCVTVPINAGLHENEIALMGASVDARLLITSKALLARLEPMIDALKLSVLVVGASGSSSYEEAMSRGSATPICAEVDEAVDGRIIRFTSGTTGAPKGVYLTHRNWLATAYCTLLDRCNMQPDDVYVGTSPYVHAGGLWLLPALIRGSAVRIVEKFDPDMLLGLIKTGNCSVLQVVPTGLRRLLDNPMATALRSGALRTVSYGGAPIDGPTLDEAAELLGSKLTQGYGLNESPIVSTLRQHDRHDDGANGVVWHQPLGREVSMAEVAILGEDGRSLPAGEVGEIVVRGPMVFREYWCNPEATAHAQRGGFFHTGDLGLRGADGSLYLAGRSKDIIVTGGYNVSPPEVEAVLLLHDAVHQCVVVGLPDREWGEQITAFVVLKPDRTATEVELIDFCRRYLTSYKKPKSVRFVTELPVNNNGKVVRRLLREEVAPAG